MRVGNPSIRRWVNKASRGEIGVEVQPATYKGVYGKATIFGLLTLVSAIATEIAVIAMLANNLVEALVGILIGTAVCGVALVIFSLIIAFVPSSVKVLGMLYCILQGGLLGCVALIVDCLVFPGISIAALLGTLIVFFVSIAVNKLFKVKISSNFMRGFMIAFFSLVIVELIMLVLTLCGVFNFGSDSSGFGVIWWIQFGVCALCIIWATIMLMWDLQNIDYLVQAGADKKYEWNVSFALVTTLIYLYIEILELLIRLVALFSSKKK